MWLTAAFILKARLPPPVKMASRQRAFSDDPPQHGIVDEEIVSGAGEGDEIMEEVEEQEDGYSVYISNFFQNPVVYIRHLLLLLIHNKDNTNRNL